MTRDQAGDGPRGSAASRAASSISRPPEACTLTMRGARATAAADGAGDCGRDVVELQVEENIRAVAATLFDERRTFRDEELEPDLEPADSARESPRRGEARRRARRKSRARQIRSRARHRGSARRTRRCARPTRSATVDLLRLAVRVELADQPPRDPGSLKFAVPTWTAEAPAEQELEHVGQLRDSADSQSGTSGRARCTW